MAETETMAEIKTVISGDVTMWKVIGILTYDELVNVLREFYAGNPTKHVVWDLSAASLAQIKFEDLEHVAEFVMQYLSSRAGGKTAIVAPDDLGFGLGRIVDSLAESKDAPIATHTFRNISDAAKWIGVEALPVID